MKKKTFGELMSSLGIVKGKLSDKDKKWMQWRERGNTNFTQLAAKVRKQGEVLISKKINGKTYYKIARKEDRQDIINFLDKQKKRVISVQIRNTLKIRKIARLSAENKKIVIETLKNFEAGEINKAKNTIKNAPEALREELEVIKINQIESELLIEAEVDEIKEYFTIEPKEKVKFLMKLKIRRRKEVNNGK